MGADPSSDPIPPAGERTASGLPPRVAATLAYTAWWVTGALFLVAEPSHAFVRFHARQAFVVFGTLWSVAVALWALSFLVVFVSPAAFRVIAMLPLAVFAIGVLLWLVCLTQAWRGRWWAVPGLRGRFGAGEAPVRRGRS